MHFCYDLLQICYKAIIAKNICFVKLRAKAGDLQQNIFPIINKKQRKRTLFSPLLFILLFIILNDLTMLLLHLHNPVFRVMQTCFSYNFPHPAD